MYTYTHETAIKTSRQPDCRCITNNVKGKSNNHCLNSSYHDLCVLHNSFKIVHKHSILKYLYNLYYYYYTKLVTRSNHCHCNNYSIYCSGFHVVDYLVYEPNTCCYTGNNIPCMTTTIAHFADMYMNQIIKTITTLMYNV